MSSKSTRAHRSASLPSSRMALIIGLSSIPCVGGIADIIRLAAQGSATAATNRRFAPRRPMQSRSERTTSSNWPGCGSEKHRHGPNGNPVGSNRFFTISLPIFTDLHFLRRSSFTRRVASTPPRSSGNREPPPKLKTAPVLECQVVQKRCSFAALRRSGTKTGPFPVRYRG